MTERVARMLIDSGWNVIPELSFNHFGERGIIDLVAWHPRRTLLVVELKTELVDVNELLGVMDRRMRLVAAMVRDRGWMPERIGGWIVLADSRTNRRHVGAHRTLLRSAFPADGRQVAGWAADPDSAQRALWFLTDDAASGLGRGLAPTKRVARRRLSSARPETG